MKSNPSPFTLKYTNLIETAVLKNNSVEYPQNLRRFLGNMAPWCNFIQKFPSKPLQWNIVSQSNIVRLLVFYDISSNSNIKKTWIITCALLWRLNSRSGTEAVVDEQYCLSGSRSDPFPSGSGLENERDNDLQSPPDTAATSPLLRVTSSCFYSEKNVICLVKWINVNEQMNGNNQQILVFGCSSWQATVTIS